MKKASYIFIYSFVNLLSNGCTARESLELLVCEKSGSGISDAAGKILYCLKKGESLASAFITSLIIPDRTYHPYILQFEKTGNILASLTLVLENMERKNEGRSRLFQAMLYPSCIISTACICLVLLFLKGIPWLLETGLIIDKSVIPGMQRGTALASVFLFLSIGITGFYILSFLKKRQKEYAFWTMLVTLTDSGLTYNQSLDICSETNGIPYKTDGSYYFFDSSDIGLFAQTMLLTARLTGDYNNTFKTIAKYQKSELIKVYALFEKIAEPVFMAITGIVILIIALYVFLPVFNQTGGFL